MCLPIPSKNTECDVRRPDPTLVISALRHVCESVLIYELLLVRPVRVRARVRVRVGLGSARAGPRS